MKDDKKKLKIKSTTVFITSLILFVISIAYILVIGITGALKTKELRFDNDVSLFKTYENKVLAVEGNSRFIVMENSAIVNSFKLEQDIVCYDFDQENIVIATSDRKIYLFDYQGNAKAVSEELLQNVEQIIFENDSIYAMTQINGRSNVIVFNMQLSAIKIQSEKTSLIRSMYLKGNNELCYITENGIFKSYSYDLNNLIEENSIDIFPSEVIFEENNIYCTSATEGVICYNYQLEKKWVTKVNGGIYKIIQGGLDGVYFINSTDRKTGFINSDGKIKFTFNAGKNVNSISINTTTDKFFILEKTNTVRYINLGTVSAYSLLNVLFYISVVALIIALSLIILSVISYKNKRFKEILLAKIKFILKNLYVSRKCYLVLLPILILVTVFCYYPALSSLKLAFYRYNVNAPDTFIGFENFAEIFRSDYITNGVLNLFKLLSTDLLKAIIPTLIFAEIIIAIISKRFQYTTRVLLYLPGILPGVAAILIWKTGIFGETGVINSFLDIVGLSGSKQIWLGNEKTSILSLILIGFPWVGAYIILYGALMGIPSSYYEAAKLDGCGYIKKIFLIDIPLIRPQLKYVLIMSFIGSIQDFQRIYLTTGGGANTNTPMLGLYKYLQDQELGLAAAMGLLMFVFLFFATVLSFKVDTEDAA